MHNLGSHPASALIFFNQKFKYSMHTHTCKILQQEKRWWLLFFNEIHQQVNMSSNYSASLKDICQHLSTELHNGEQGPLLRCCQMLKHQDMTIISITFGKPT